MWTFFLWLTVVYISERGTIFILMWSFIRSLGRSFSESVLLSDAQEMSCASYGIWSRS
jgi:hypothetical protein